MEEMEEMEEIIYRDEEMGMRTRRRFTTSFPNANLN